MFYGDILLYLPDITFESFLVNGAIANLLKSWEKIAVISCTTRILQKLSKADDVILLNAKIYSYCLQSDNDKNNYRSTILLFESKLLSELSGSTFTGFFVFTIVFE